MGHVQSISKKDRILGDLNAHVCLLSSCGFAEIISIRAGLHSGEESGLLRKGPAPPEPRLDAGVFQIRIHVHPSCRLLSKS